MRIVTIVVFLGMTFPPVWWVLINPNLPAPFAWAWHGCCWVYVLFCLRKWP